MVELDWNGWKSKFWTNQWAAFFSSQLILHLGRPLFFRDMLGHGFFNPFNKFVLFKTVFAHFTPIDQNFFQLLDLDFFEVNGWVIVRLRVFELANLRIFLIQSGTNFFSWFVEWKWFNNVLKWQNKNLRDTIYIYIRKERVVLNLPYA